MPRFLVFELLDSPDLVPVSDSTALTGAVTLLGRCTTGELTALWALFPDLFRAADDRERRAESPTVVMPRSDVMRALVESVESADRALPPPGHGEDVEQVARGVEMHAACESDSEGGAD